MKCRATSEWSAIFSVALSVWLGGPILVAAPLPPIPLPPTEQPGEDQGPTSNEGLGGSEVYAKECAVCHGAEGQGTERAYPIRFPVAFYASAVTRSGRSGNPRFAIPMPAYDEAKISDEQLTEIWGFLSSFPRPETGKELFESFCGNCHGQDGRGGMTGKNILHELDEFSEYIRKGKHTRTPLNRRKFMPAFRPEIISSDEVRLMRRYASELRQQGVSGGEHKGKHGEDDDDDED